MTFCLEKMNDDRRDRRFIPQLTLPPDGVNVILSDDTPTKIDVNCKVKVKVNLYSASS